MVTVIHGGNICHTMENSPVWMLTCIVHNSLDHEKLTQFCCVCFVVLILSKFYNNYSDIAFPKSLVNQLFVQQFAQANSKENVINLRSTHDWWNPLTKSQWCRNSFYVMTFTFTLFYCGKIISSLWFINHFIVVIWSVVYDSSDSLTPVIQACFTDTGAIIYRIMHELPWIRILVMSEVIWRWFSWVTKSRAKIIGKSHYEWPKYYYSW